jgi:hypothetical protein
MDKIRELTRNPLATAIVGFVVGLIIGLPILGWGLWPVKWENADPARLRADYMQDYLCTTIDSYARKQDAAAAQSRFELLGAQGQKLLDALTPEACGLTETDINMFRAAVQGPAMAVPGQATAQPETAPAATDDSSGGSKVGLVIGLCLVTLLVGGGLVYLLVFRNRMTGAGKPSQNMPAQDAAHTAVAGGDYAAQGQESPIAQFMTTYMLGDDLYDDSFSVDSPSGEFLGECGVGISETIGVGDPKKVTAMEVWLFDKNDIQTVTKVLMSPHAFNDPAIHQRLESKGEPIEVGKEKHVLLETATLQLEARVVDLSLGGGALPEDSYFERLTLELAIWPKA